MSNNAPVATATQQQQIVSSLPPPASPILRYRNDPWAFMCECVYTLDQTDKLTPIKQYPGVIKPHLQILTNHIVNETLLAVVKHRRMMATWTMCGVFLWDAMFHEGRLNVLISKKEEDSDDLVRRCKFIYDNIPDALMPIKPKFTYKYTEFGCTELDSRIKGVAAGKDQLRQYTCSRIGADEFGFWPNARETFVAMRPTLQGGGRVCLISTRFPGFFQQIVEDTIDDT